MHRDCSDIFVAVAGEASLVSGGTLIDAKVIAEGEQRGSAIQNGSTQKIASGSVIHIDPGVAHQLLVENGTFSYFVVKVKSK